MREPPYKNYCVIFNSVNRPVNSTYKANVYNKFLISLTNFSVNVYVAVDISMNSNTIICGKVPSGKDLYHLETSRLIYSADQSGGLDMVRVFEKSDFQTIYHETDFCNILRHIVKSKVIQNLKKLLKPESVNRSELMNSVYLWLNFSILLSHVFLKSRRGCRLKSIFMCITFLCSFFYSPFKHRSVYNYKLSHQIEVFTPEYLNANNKLHEAFLNPQYTVLTISKLKQINNKSFYRLLIILSGDISLNSGSVCKHQILNTTEWDIFKTKGLHLMHLNINSLLPKIDELRHMGRLSNAAVI